MSCWRSHCRRLITDRRLIATRSGLRDRCDRRCRTGNGLCSSWRQGRNLACWPNDAGLRIDAWRCVRRGGRYPRSGRPADSRWLVARLRLIIGTRLWLCLSARRLVSTCRSSGGPRCGGGRRSVGWRLCRRSRCGGGWWSHCACRVATNRRCGKGASGRTSRVRGNLNLWSHCRGTEVACRHGQATEVLSAILRTTLLTFELTTRVENHIGRPAIDAHLAGDCGLFLGVDFYGNKVSGNLSTNSRLAVDIVLESLTRRAAIGVEVHQDQTVGLLGDADCRVDIVHPRDFVGRSGNCKQAHGSGNEERQSGAHVQFDL